MVSQIGCDNQTPNATIPTFIEEKGGIHSNRDTHRSYDTPSISELTLYVEQAVRQRETARKARIKTNNQLKALEKFGATNIFYLDYLKEQMKQFEVIEHKATKAIEKQMKQHPLASWIQNECPGIGLDSAASILNITGPLNLYDCPSKVWKVLGLHVLNGEAPDIKKFKHQKECMNNRYQLSQHPDYKGVDYSPKGHGLCFVMGGRINMQKPHTKYKAIITSRREHTAITHPEWTPLHSLRDGQRVAVKAFVKDMWCMWRDMGLKAERIRLRVEDEEDQYMFE